MLSKLMYHEFKATRRVFFPAYGIMLALAVISSVFMILSNNLQRLAVPLSLLLLAYVLSLFAVGVLSFVYMIVRFYKNLLGDEGYLMFTLPATPAQLVWSKCLVSTIWMVVSTILCIVTLGILLIPLMLETISTADASFWQAIHLGFQYIAPCDYFPHPVYHSRHCVYRKQLHAHLRLLVHRRTVQQASSRRSNRCLYCIRHCMEYHFLPVAVFGRKPCKYAASGCRGLL